MSSATHTNAPRATELAVKLTYWELSVLRLAISQKLHVARSDDSNDTGTAGYLTRMESLYAKIIAVAGPGTRP